MHFIGQCKWKDQEAHVGDGTVCMAYHVLYLCILGDLLCIWNSCIIRNYVCMCCIMIWVVALDLIMMHVDVLRVIYVFKYLIIIIIIIII